MPKVTKINHIAVVVPDLDSSLTSGEMHWAWT